MPIDIEEQKNLILKELESYKTDNSCMKPLFQSMKEISAWLKEREK